LKTTIGYDFGVGFKELAERGEADVAIVSTEDGYSPLGASRRFFERDLRVSHSDEFGPLARWNRHTNPRITLVAIPTNNPEGLLRGIILAPGGNAVSYQQYAGPNPTSVDETFYYQVTYQAIAHACRYWGARRLAISHLSASGRFHERIATSQARALADFCQSQSDAAPRSFVFCGCCIEPKHLRGIERMNDYARGWLHEWPDYYRHERPTLQVEIEEQGVAMLIHLQWQKPEYLSVAMRASRARRSAG
jgi:hypothetical protein